MDRMLLHLKRSPEQETALENLIDEQQDPASLNYHRWLAPEEFGRQFGPSDQDMAVVTAWLQSHGFSIGQISKGRTIIEFSGTASQVRNAFHTTIHQYVTNDQTHWANASDPQIPAALASVIGSVASLHNFELKPQIVMSDQQLSVPVPGNAAVAPQLNFSDGHHALSPADFRLIYSASDSLSSGIDGAGTSIAVVGRSNINLQDVVDFRKIFYLPDNLPQVVVNGPDPGNRGGNEEMEALLDTSWSGAIAPNANIQFVVSQTTNASDGVFLSEIYVIDNNLAGIMTESFGTCEANVTRGFADAISSLAQQAAAQGITYVVSSGDSGTAECYRATKGTSPSVNVLASTPYTTAVGGTQFNEAANSNIAYWSSTGTFPTALRYIPETVWNESCASPACTTSVAAGGGGASIFFPKPAWQSEVSGIPEDGARDVPDVSLTAAVHDGYIVCARGSCQVTDGKVNFYIVGGTSAAAPAFASVMAMVSQKMQLRLGLVNPMLYKLAAKQDVTSCDSYNAPYWVACSFNDITVGNNAIPGQLDYGAPGARYTAGPGYDLATGLGSVSVQALLWNWSAFGGTTRPKTYIDQPVSNGSPLIGSTLVSGWSINFSSQVSNVAVAIDGRAYGNVSYGASRFDVCQYFYTYPFSNCANSGWSMPLDTTNLPDGSHLLTVTATSKDGVRDIVTSTFSVANTTAGNFIKLYVDSPRSQNGPFSGIAHFGGWAFDYTAAIHAVTVAVDGVPYGNASYGMSRGDVCQVFPNRIGCPNVGWNFSFDTTLFADGNHTFEVTVLSKTGRRSTVSTPFVVANATSTGPFKLYVDQPSSSNIAVSGIAAMEGWAISDNAAIREINIAIDGVAYGDAQYGVARPDVCQVYPNRPGCPNVGWSFLLDTRVLSNGPHTLALTAASVLGQHWTVEKPFMVSNNAAGNPVTVFIDQPSLGKSTLFGVSPLYGWAVSDTSSISTVSIRVDDVPLEDASYGGYRADVCGVFPNRAGCPSVGWSFSLDTAALPDGPHILSVTATAADSIRSTSSASFQVANGAAGNPTKLYIDTPMSSSGPLAGSVMFNGWAIDLDTSIASVAVFIDGASYGNATYGNSRADVCVVYAYRLGCPNVGWSFWLDTNLLPNGPHTLQITGVTAKGQRATISTPFVVANSATANGITIYSDVPGPSHPVLGGVESIFGWAIADTAVVKTVAIYIDGLPYGNAAYGDSRADVCQVYPNRPNCPNVGWSFLLDTTLLPEGDHILATTVTTATGEHATKSNPFRVRNAP
jgi:hypothetical protein